MRKITSLTILILLLLALTSCKQARTPVTKTGLYFDTIISITLYEKNSSELIDECLSIADKYDKLFSKTNPDSDISKVNSTTDWTPINQETFDLITSTFKYEDLSRGKFSVMCGALVDLWDIPKRSASLPSSKEIENAIRLCGKDTLDVDSSTTSVRINTVGAKLDLGAVAKGYVADKMKEYLISQGVESGIIQLGGNVLTIGNNPTKESGLYSIGITKPFSNDGEVITTVTTEGDSVVTSGNYQRYFEYGGKIYHHIIDLTTGYPADTGLNSVTVICDSSTEADIMSTILFLSGKEKGIEFVDSLNLTDAIFIDNENNIIH